MSHQEDNVLELSAALTVNDRTAAIASGRIVPEGIRLLTTRVHASEMFWRQLKYAEFDVSEMSLSSLLIATSKGPTEWVAVPVFTMRHFFHTSVLVRDGAGIAAPADLRGKRVGVPEYQQTWAVWTRGILKDEYGVDPRELTWFMERSPAQSHGGATGFTAPPGVTLHYIPQTTNIGEMMVSGELDATLLYLRSDGNLIDRSTIDLESRGDIRRLFPDRAAEAKRYYAATGIFPINHTVVVRRSVLTKYPWVALNIYNAFLRAKNELTAQRDSLLVPYVEAGLLDAHARTALERDPLAYGLASSRTVVETIARYVYEQGLAERLVSVEDVFAPSCLEV